MGKSSLDLEEEAKVVEEGSVISTTIGNENLDKNGLAHRLSTRHIVMITLGNSIGMSLWLGTANQMTTGGPVGTWLSWFLLVTVAICLSNAVGELSVLYPVPAPFTQWAHKFIDKPWAITVGFDYWMVFVLNFANEITAANTVVHYWTNQDGMGGGHADVVPTAGWLTIFFVIMVATNLFGVAVFGEIETWEATLKFIWIFVVIIACIVVSCKLGIGFHFWRVDPFAHGFKGFLKALAIAGWSVGGIEFTAVVAPEAKNPFRSVPKAVNSIWLRMTLFYIIGVMMVTITVSPGDPRLSGGGVSASPFTIAFKDGGVPGLAHAMNGIILVSVVSAGCAYLFGGARQLHGLATMGYFPKIFAQTDRWGRPWVALITTAIIGGGLSYLNVSDEASSVFGWFIDLSTLGYNFLWATIFICNIRMRYVWKFQGRSLNELPWKSYIAAYGSYYGLIWMILIIVDVFYLAVWPLGEPSSAKTFFANFLSMIIIIVLYTGLKLWYRDPFYTKAENVDLDGSMLRVYTEEEMKRQEFSKESLKLKNLPKTIDKLIFE